MMYRDEDCKIYMDVLNELYRLLDNLYNSNLFDINLALTSEGKKAILRIYREMLKNNLRCIKVMKEVIKDFNKIYKLYECIENELANCLS